MQTTVSPSPVAWSGPAPKVSGVYSGPRHILHPSLVEVCSVISFNPADKPTNIQTNGHRWKQPCLLQANFFLLHHHSFVEQHREESWRSAAQCHLKPPQTRQSAVRSLCICENTDVRSQLKKIEAPKLLQGTIVVSLKTTASLKHSPPAVRLTRTRTPGRKSYN